MEELQQQINNIEQVGNKSVDFYNSLLIECVNFREMRATVYVYDDMLKNKVNPSNKTFSIIEKLHSKIIPESNKININQVAINLLQPRRRIHKIIKGHNYSKNYNSSMKHLEDVKTYLNLNPQFKCIKNRHKLAKLISKNCKLSINDSRYIITKLKRIKYLTEESKIETTKDTVRLTIGK